MLRAYCAAQAAGKSIVRLMIGLSGLAIVVGMYGPSSERTGAMSSQLNDTEQGAMSANLPVRDGALGRHSIIVDASGRKVATVSQWSFGGMTVISSRDSGVGVSFQLNPDGSAKMRVKGSDRITAMDVARDGTLSARESIGLPALDGSRADCDQASLGWMARKSFE